MRAFGPATESRVSARTVAYLLIGVAGLAFCITLLFLSMRAVLDIGGACADGGPYVSRQSCPPGVPLATVGSIFGLFLFGGLTGVGGVQIGGRYAGIVLLAWPALFLSLGWNFLEYGLRPPGTDGPDVAWLFCALVFFMIGGGPLLGMLPGRVSRRDPIAMRRLLADLRARQRQLAGARGDDGRGDRRSELRMDLTSRLERLAQLHAAGNLTDAEFDAAKRRVIAEVAAGR